jgi:hypothetical protein
MKQALIVGVVIIVLAGGWFFLRGNQASTPADESSPTGSNALPNPAMQPKESGVISSIKDAMGLGKTMQCTYASSTGKDAVTSTVLVDGKKFLAETSVNGKKSHVLSDGDVQYIWSDDSKQGMKMSMTCLADLQKSLPAAAQSAPEDYAKTFDTANNVNCTAVSGGVSLSVPSDVTFTDQCAMLKESMKALEGMKGKIPGY